MAYGNTITEILNTWADFGIFAYVLPFLMIFAVIFGILNKSKILGDNKGVQAVISLAIGLMALQFDYVSNFFATIFPYAGIGLAVLLVAMILMGLITQDNNVSKWIWLTLGFIIFVVVILFSFADFAWFGGYAGTDVWKGILTAVLIVGIMAFVIWGNKDATPGSGKSN